VNRFYWDNGYKGGGLETLEGVRNLRVNLSANWAPGSSGSAVFDQSGNVIAHVSKISGMSSKRTGGSAMITLHTGIPARAVGLLARSAADSDALDRPAVRE